MSEVIIYISYSQIAGALLQSEPGANIECYVYVIDLNLTGPITEDQNTRGRKIYAPEETSQCFGILTSKLIPVVSVLKSIKSD